MQDSGVTSRNRSSSADRDIEMRFASKNIRKALIEVTKYLQQAANASANHFQVFLFFVFTPLSPDFFYTLVKYITNEFF